MSNDPIVNQVAGLNDIVEVISGYFPLKRSGRNFKACCPFHPEKTPSFMVNPERQIFHCFGCSVGGDVFSFVMKIENASFPEALKKLADRVHMILPERKGSRETQAGKSRKEKLHEICHLASQFYRRNFLDSKLGLAARDYMKRRGFGMQVLDLFGVGYATEGWQSLYDFLAKKGYSEELIFASGLVRRGENGRAFDLFRKRVIFPIANSQSRVIAFGGRGLDQETSPKYLNSPETEIFKKRDELYGLFHAKKHVDPDKSQFLVVEGYLDLIRLVESGFPNSVATLGTSLTPDHCRLLRRYVMQAVLVYDGDRAGESASIRGIDVFLEEGMDVKLLALPQGLDPDDFLKNQGSEPFRKLLENAQDVFDFKISHLLKRLNPKETVGLVRITNEVLEMLAKIKNDVLIARYIRRLAGTLGIDENSIRKEFAKLKAKSKGSTEKQEMAAPVSSAPDLREHEWTLISLALRRREYLVLLVNEIESKDFRNPDARSCFQYLSELESQKKEKALFLSSLLDRIASESARAFLSRISFFELSEEDCGKAFADCLKKIKSESCEEKLSDVLAKMKEAEARGEEDKVFEFIRQYQTLVGKKKVGL